MDDSTLFISDLHLCAERPAIIELFLDFLTQARHTQALYVLGDLFEYWIGDEAVTMEEYRPIVEGLRRATSAGLHIFVMHGNRDFLMGQGFERATGCRLLPDFIRIDLYGTPVLLMHGDTLCTDDVEYMTFRAMVRDANWQKEFLAKSITERESIIRRFRKQSKMATARKKPQIMDATQQAVEAAMRAHGVRHLIHGHTHRPAEHRFELDGQPARRVVLGDWYEQGSVLRCDAQAWRRDTLTRYQGGALSRSAKTRTLQD